MGLIKAGIGAQWAADHLRTLLPPALPTEAGAENSKKETKILTIKRR